MHRLDDAPLLATRELAHGFERPLHLADGAGVLGDGFIARGGEQLLDVDAEGFGHLGQYVGARRLVAPLPEGDVGVRDAQEFS